MPKIICICGCNGSGKSTFAKTLALQEKLIIIDPDQLSADGLTPIQAGKSASKLVRELLAQHISFIRESTLTSQFDFKIMKSAKEVGYQVELIYITLSSVELALKRIQERHKRGGHDVPLQDVIRRYNRSLANLEKAIKIADKYTILDNSTQIFRLVS